MELGVVVDPCNHDTRDVKTGGLSCRLAFPLCLELHLMWRPSPPPQPGLEASLHYRGKSDLRTTYVCVFYLYYNSISNIR